MTRWKMQERLNEHSSFCQIYRCAIQNQASTQIFATSTVRITSAQGVLIACFPSRRYARQPKKTHSKETCRNCIARILAYIFRIWKTITNQQQWCPTLQLKKSRLCAMKEIIQIFSSRLSNNRTLTWTRLYRLTSSLVTIHATRPLHSRIWISTLSPLKFFTEHLFIGQN